MKNKLTLLIALLLILIVPAVQVHAAAPETETKSMIAGETCQIKLGKHSYCTSSNPSVATVSFGGGKIVARKKGTAKITVYKNYKKVKIITVKVENPVKIGDPAIGFPGKEKTKEMEFTVLDVGQGSATLIQTDGLNILVDTGSYNQLDSLERQLDEKAVDVIDYLFISHPDADHMGSAATIIKEYDVKMIFTSSYDKKTTACYKKMLEAIEENQVKVYYPRTGEEICFGSYLGIKILSANAAANDTDEANAGSLVLSAQYKGKKCLIMGDAPVSVENTLVKNYKSVIENTDILVVGHHGSITSSGAQFVSVTKPDYACISVGADNNYGHPNGNVLKRLTKYAGHVLRTDLNGQLSFCITDKGVKQNK